MIKKISFGLLCLIILACLTFGGALLIASANNDISVRDQFFNWFPALEQTVETEDEKSDDVVIEDETEEENGEQTEGEETNGEQTEGEETNGEQTSGEDQTQTE